jgi:transcriptional regulator with XRE-family HTH domain
VDVIEWLLDSDPSIRWQVMRDLTNEPGDVVVAERSKVAHEGWGALLLSLQDENGQWGRGLLEASRVSADGVPDPVTRRLLREAHRATVEDLAGFLGLDPALVSALEEGDLDAGEEGLGGYLDAMRSLFISFGTYVPKWVSTTYTLLELRDMGLDPESEEAVAAVSLVRDNSKWDEGGQAFFDGEVEPCINGMTVAIGAYFDQKVDVIVNRLLGERLADGGWNCEAERGSTRSSFHTTICVLEGLLEYERRNGASTELTAARSAGEEYLLERHMMRRLSDGEIVDSDWRMFSFPPRWHYDVLRGLDYLRDAGKEPDERCHEAVELVASKRGADGRWPLENTHPGQVHFTMEEGDEKPSRWNTLRAMRVLDWHGRPAPIHR